MPRLARLPLIATTSFTVAVLAAVVAAPAAAQTPAGDRAGPPPVSIGGELAGFLAPSDDDAFFNYTDYEQNGVRLVRARLFGEWRASESVQAIAELRLENGRDVELAAWYLRWRPRSDWPLFVQAGRVPPVIGAFARRAYGRDNPVMGAPLAYQYLTSLRQDAAPADVDDLLRMRGRGWQPSYPIGSSAIGPGLALASSTDWSTGVEAIWRAARFELAGAVTRGAPSTPGVLGESPGLQWSGRATIDLPGGAIAGVSAARGRWLDRDVLRAIAGDRDTGGRQSVVGADLEYGYGPWLLRGEWIRAGYDLPLASVAGAALDLASYAGFAELRWRPHPRWQLAGRAGFLRFSDVDGDRFPDGPWDAPVDRLEAAVNYRVTRRLDVRAGWQHNWRNGGRVGSRGIPMAAVLFWF